MSLVVGTVDLVKGVVSSEGDWGVWLVTVKDGQLLHELELLLKILEIKIDYITRLSFFLSFLFSIKTDVAIVLPEAQNISTRYTSDVTPD